MPPKYSEEQWKNLPRAKQAENNLAWFKYHKHIIKQGKCVHDLELPLLQTTWEVSTKRDSKTKDMLFIFTCAICGETFKR